VTAVETVVNLDVLPRVEGVRFRRGGAVETVRSLLKSSRRWDVVLLDPPRAGARELMPLLAALAPPRVIYVSCDPSTFARDGALLVEEGYSLARVVPFDMMPQTFHVELAALFEKS
jgi:23S rRNA (uracil1939-C5)-methyltransferase